MFGFDTIKIKRYYNTKDNDNHSVENMLFNNQKLGFGIYFLVKGSEVVYIGKAKNLGKRIHQHKCNRLYVGSKKVERFDYAEAYVLNNIADIHWLEPYLINKLKPKWNKDFVEQEYPSLNINWKKLVSKRYKIVFDEQYLKTN